MPKYEVVIQLVETHEASITVEAENADMAEDMGQVIIDSETLTLDDFERVDAYETVVHIVDSNGEGHDV